MKYLFKKVVNLIFLFPKSVQIKFIRHFFRNFSEISDNFLTYHFRPKFFKDMHLKNNINDKEKVAILLQGPIIFEDNFTEETIKIYKKNFPRAIIILSTWEDHKEKIYKNFSNLGIFLIFNKKPKFSGPKIDKFTNSNINYQITSTKSGISLAKKHRVKYILKTRTDFRLYSNNCLNYLLNLLKIFPSENNLQKCRIIGTNFTLKYRMYGLSDTLLFGNINDINKYFDHYSILETDCVFDNFFKISFLKKNKKLIDLKKFVPEVFLFTNYLNKINVKILWTLKNYHYLISKYFIVIDNSHIDLFWNKYNKEDEYREKSYYESKFDKINFSDWLDLYLKNK